MIEYGHLLLNIKSKCFYLKIPGFNVDSYGISISIISIEVKFASGNSIPLVLIDKKDILKVELKLEL